MEKRNLCSFGKTMQNYLENEAFDVIIDVRTAEEYAAGHVRDALHMALENIDQYQGNKSDHIALYCRSGRRSALAKDILEQLGYQSVTNIGGIIDESTPLVKQ